MPTLQKTNLIDYRSATILLAAYLRAQDAKKFSAFDMSTILALLFREDKETTLHDLLKAQENLSKGGSNEKSFKHGVHQNFI